jgi:hypothetical protein
VPYVLHVFVSNCRGVVYEKWNQISSLLSPGSVTPSIMFMLPGIGFLEIGNNGHIYASFNSHICSALDRMLITRNSGNSV